MIRKSSLNIGSYANKNKLDKIIKFVNDYIVC